MPKTSTLTVRVDPALKQKTEAILRDLGLTPSQAITLFLHQVARVRGLPFVILADEEGTPNRETIAAMEDLLQRRNIRTFETAEALFEELGM